jgi:hypothetical protein
MNDMNDNLIGAVFLVTQDDGDFYSKRVTLAAFDTRLAACDFALSMQAAEMESFGEVLAGLEVNTFEGPTCVDTIDAVPMCGVGTDAYVFENFRRDRLTFSPSGWARSFEVTNLDAAYRSLERHLYTSFSNN